MLSNRTWRRSAARFPTYSLSVNSFTQAGELGEEFTMCLKRMGIKRYCIVLLFLTTANIYLFSDRLSAMFQAVSLVSGRVCGTCSGVKQCTCGQVAYCGKTCQPHTHPPHPTSQTLCCCCSSQKKFYPKKIKTEFYLTKKNSNPNIFYPIFF